MINYTVDENLLGSDHSEQEIESIVTSVCIVQLGTDETMKDSN